MSVYDTIREGLQSDWRKAREYDDMKLAIHNLVYGLERALLVMNDDSGFSKDAALKRNVIDDAKRFIKDAKDKKFI